MKRGPTIEQREAEVDALMREIHNRARELATLRLRRRQLSDRLRSHRAGWARGNPVKKKANRAACKRWRAKKKAERLANPYMDRKYQDVVFGGAAQHDTADLVVARTAT